MAVTLQPRFASLVPHFVIVIVIALVLRDHERTMAITWNERDQDQDHEGVIPTSQIAVGALGGNGGTAWSRVRPRAAPSAT